MKNRLLIILLFCCNYSFANNPVVDMAEVRTLYQKAVKDENSCKKLIEMLAPYNEKNNPLLSGYRASGTMLMAKHVFNPVTKMSWFKKGKLLLAKAIEADPQNIELRFLRFTAQTNTPSFLGYKDDIPDDKKFLINSYSKIKDQDLKVFVLPVLNKSKYITQAEKQQLENK